MARTEETALVTGASAGIGLELARLAAQAGHDLVLVARRRDRLEALATELGAAYGVKVTVMAADLSDRAAPGQIAEHVHAAGTRIDYLMNNAGFGTCGPFQEATLERQVQMIEVNIQALVQLTHLFLPEMLARKRGRILNIASIAGFVPGPFMATYYASKAFVVSFTEALAKELCGSGVTVTASCPGPTATEFGVVAQSKDTNLFRRGGADAGSVARHAYRAMLAGKVVVVPGFMNKLTAQSIRIAPRAVVRAVAAFLNRK